jgi:membrane protein
MKFARLRQLLTAAFGAWWDDRAMTYGASISYYTLFALAPVLLMAIAIAGIFFGQDAVRGVVVEQLASMIGLKGAAVLEDLIASASNFGSGVLGGIAGFLLFLLAATGVFVELQDALNAIWKVKRQERSGLITFLRTRLLSLAVIVGIGFVLMVAFVLDATLSAVGAYISSFVPGLAALLHVLNFMLSLVVTTLLFGVIYKVLPDADLSWRDVRTGAIVTALLFALGKFLIAFYIGKSDPASSYGASASVITIMIWVYYSSQIVLFGAEITKVYTETRGTRSPAGSQIRAETGY